jgi:aryl-alcohol dehydrogenase-like predicted oxidoreductase|tara:strand:+ start:637 stop:1557 length:921 start_codon:yes stop_codon:yes gene_type:complete
MNYHDFKGEKISKLTLGTAQLGMKYGIANQKGNLSIDEANEIIKNAINFGINSFDTAQNYGQSEEILGKFLIDLENENFPIITTKISNIQFNNYSELNFKILNSIKNSQKKFYPNDPSIYLLHDVKNIEKDSDEIKKLQELQKNRKIKWIGISTYTPLDVKKFLEIENLDVIQIPINIFDHRLLNTGLLEELKEQKKLIFARSIYLQGLFYLDLENIPENLSSSKKFLKKLKEIAQMENLTSAELAFQFVKELESISSMIIGVETVEQLKQNIDLLNMPKMSENCKEEIMKEFNNIQENIINPTLW